MPEYNIILTGIFIFFAKIFDVSIGTVRIIITVQGRTVIAFVLGLIEVMIWLLVISTVINQVREEPILIAFYSFGYATGNLVGIIIERKLAFGITILRVITRNAGKVIADYLRNEGQPVTVFVGEGMKGPVNELYIACRRRDIKWILPEVKRLDKQAFYVIEQACDVSKILRPTHTPIGGWLAVFKKKDLLFTK
jgi:uncharacterized protein YebE (UPF0316 family)